MKNRLQWLKASPSWHLMTLGLVTLAAMLHSSVYAFTTPAAGSFAYDLYDVGVNQVLLGAPGFVGAVVIMVVSAVNLTRNWVMSIAGLLSGVVLIKADTITQSMGALI